jgi:hypothetical protein
VRLLVSSEQSFESGEGGLGMLSCWIFGHRYEYELKSKGGELSLICTKCGDWRTLIKNKIADTDSTPGFFGDNSSYQTPH